MKNIQLKTIGKIFLGIIVAFSLLIGCSKDLFYISESVQEEMNKAIEGGFDGMIVYVNQSGKSKFYSAGFNNREKQTLADPHSLFKIASISKLYIAAAATKLLAIDSLSLDQTLAELIPEVENRIEFADQITLRMMISHRSGIPEYIYEPEFKSGTSESYMSTAALIYDKSADFKPNKKYKYSNSNYLLLGEILDRTLGYSHHIFIRNEILNPLGLNDTYYNGLEKERGTIISGYFDDDGYNSYKDKRMYTRLSRKI